MCIKGVSITHQKPRLYIYITRRWSSRGPSRVLRYQRHEADGISKKEGFQVYSRRKCSRDASITLTRALRHFMRGRWTVARGSSRGLNYERRRRRSLTHPPSVLHVCVRLYLSIRSQMRCTTRRLYWIGRGFLLQLGRALSKDHSIIEGVCVWGVD